MEKQSEKKKMKISPEQVEMACKKMGETADAVDNVYSNVKDRLGAVGKAVGFGVLVTLVLALVHSPGLVWVLAIAIAVGAAPLIHKKVLELKSAADEKAAEMEKAKEAAKSEEEKK